MSTNFERNKDLNQRWFEAVRFIADSAEGSYEKFQHITLSMEGSIKGILHQEGFSKNEIHTAFNWIELSHNSGNLQETFSMLTKEISAPRIRHPLEDISLSEAVWQQIELYQQRRLIDTEIAERLIEGIRNIEDARDWTAEEAKEFITQLIDSDHSKSELGDQLPADVTFH